MSDKAPAKVVESPRSERAPSKRERPASLPAHPILRLQCAIGNRAFSKLVRTKLRVGQAGDIFEREADRVAEQVMRMPAGGAGAIAMARDPLGGLRRQCRACAEAEGKNEDEDELRRKENGSAPAATPEAGVLNSGGAPLPPNVRAFYEPRFGRHFRDVRVHTGEAAARHNDDLNAHAFTYGHHIWMGAGKSLQPSLLLAHELAHVVQAQSATPVVRRKEKKDDEPDKFERLQVFATGMDAAALTLAQSGLQLRGAENLTRRFIGLHPQFLKVYDQAGKTLARIKLKETKGLRFAPGVYVAGHQGVTALTINKQEVIGAEAPGRSVIAQRPYTAEEKAAMAKEQQAATAEHREVKPPPTQNLNIADLVADPDKLRQLTSAPNLLVIYFVPTYEGGESGSGKSEAERRQTYAAPIETRGDGQPPNAPPWPVQLEAPRIAPVGAAPTFKAKVDWTANGNFSLTSQVISQVGEEIHYKWELFDVSKYAARMIVADPAHATDETRKAQAKAAIDYKQKLEELKTAAKGEGKDVTGMGAANHAFNREFDDWWRDTKRAAKDSQNPSGDTAGERFSHRVANETALELAPVSLLVTSLGAVLRWGAELFAGERQQKEVVLDSKGFYLVRVITTPIIHEDREGRKIIRPPSVDAKLVEVSEIDKNVREVLDEPSAQIAELESQIKQAEAAHNKSKADYLRQLLAGAKFRFGAAPIEVLDRELQQKSAELDDFRAKYPSLSDYSRQHEVDLLQDREARFIRHQADALHEGGGALRRLNAAVISEETGEQYPLLLSGTALAVQNDGKTYRWLISDVSNREGDSYIGQGATPSLALQAALTKFAGEAKYGRGRIGAYTAGLGLEERAPKEVFVDSQPVDWSIASKRIDDLVETLAALGLFVATAGTAAALIGAGVAAARLIQRWSAGRLYLDEQTVGDVLSLLGGLGASGQLAAGLRVQKFGDAFAILREGEAAETEIANAAKAFESALAFAKQVEVANEVIGYAGLFWGNVSFINQMIAISDDELADKITHAAARRARAQAIGSAVQNNGFFIAGNVMKAKQAAKKEKAVAREKTPIAEKPVVEGEPTALREQDAKAKRPADPGHDAIVTDEGVGRCSPSCPVIGVVYAKQLADRPKWRERYAEIVKLGKVDPDAAAQEAGRFIKDQLEPQRQKDMAPEYAAMAKRNADKAAASGDPSLEEDFKDFDKDVKLDIGEKRAADIAAGKRDFVVDRPLTFDVDEVLPVGDPDPAVPRSERIRRALDAFNRQLLDPQTNRASKGVGVDPRQPASPKGPLKQVSVVTDPNALVTRRLGEIVEVKRLFDQAVAKITPADLANLKPTEIKAKVNAELRRSITESPSPDAVAVRNALKQLGFARLPGVGYAAQKEP